MAKFLHTLGEWAFKNPWKTTSVWLVLLSALGLGAIHYFKPTSAEISIPGTEAQTAIDRANELFPGGGKGTGRIVFQTSNDKSVQDYSPQINTLLRKVRERDGVAQVAGPSDDASFIATSGKIAYAQVQLDASAGAADKTLLDGIQNDIQSARTDGLQIESGGDLVNRSPDEILGIGEVAGVLVALLVLFMTLGSLIAAGMPLLTALIGVGVSMAGLFAMSQLFTINSTTPVLAVMLGLAVGIDYSLFIISRYRTYVMDGVRLDIAAGRAIGTAGNAVVFAALTVVIALAALSIVNIPFMTTMGLVGAGSIAVAALVAITLIPALLGFAKMRIVSKKAATTINNSTDTKVVKHNFWYRWGQAIVKKPVPILVAATVAIGIIAIPAKDLRLGLPTDQYAAEDSTARKAYDILANGFGAGFNGPLTVVVEGLPKVSDADRESIRSAALSEYNTQVAAATQKAQSDFQQRASAATSQAELFALQQEAAAAQAAGQVQQQQALVEIEKSVDQFAKFVQLKKAADEIAKRDNIALTQPAIVTDDGTAGIIQVIPSSAPADAATSSLIAQLRDPNTAKNITANNNLSFAVTGSTALQEDISDKLAAALPIYLGVVVGLSLILLIIAFRSIIVPIKATLGFLLSVAAMFGALVAVFQWGWLGIADAPGPIVSFIPIIAIGILFGLAMDYEFFLVSGMHESYTKTKDAKQAVVQGFGAGSKVVTAAAVIMISVFAGFITNHDATIQAMGFGLAFGILIDAFLVRMTIVPAVMSLLGKSAWWIPSWLDRRLPRVSIEGEE